VAWEILDMRQTLEEGGSRMRWDFKNTSEIAIDFERVEMGSRAGGSLTPSRVVWTRYATRTTPSRAPSSGYARAAPGAASSVLTLLGHDAAGGGVRVPTALRLNSSVGERK
jgi:hypothetical protein